MRSGAAKLGLWDQTVFLNRRLSTNCLTLVANYTRESVIFINQKFEIYTHRAES